MSRVESISVVIPVYNSAEMLPELVERLGPVLRDLAERYELVLVNDGSPDRSWPVIRTLAADHDWVRGISLMRNYGQHNALLCGIRSAKHDIIVTMDDDLQHPPEEIPKLLEALGEDMDVVYGTPENEKHDLLRTLASRFTKLALETTMRASTARMVSAFRVFRTTLRDAFAEYRSPYVSVDILLVWATVKFTSVSVRHEPRAHGVSNYTVRKLATHAINMVTGFSTLPLQFASWIGFAFTLVGIGTLAYVIGTYLVLGHSVPGFPFLASVIAIFSGAQLFALGIIGEYLARMHFRMMERPTYAVRERVARVEP